MNVKIRNRNFPGTRDRLLLLGYISRVLFVIKYFSRVRYNEVQLPAGAGFTFRSVVPSAFLQMYQSEYKCQSSAQV